MATQNTVSSKKASNPQPKPQFYCEPCRKTFNSKSGRRQHLRNSLAHKETQNVARQTSSNQALIKTQNKTAIKTQDKTAIKTQDKTTIKTQDKTTIKTQNKTENKTQDQAQKQANNQAQRTGELATVQRLPAQMDGNALSKSKQKNSVDTAKKETVPKGPWSMYDLAQIPSLYKELSRHCHSTDDLSRNKYEVSTYTAEDIDGLRKCKKCGRLAKNSRNTECYFHPKKAVPATKTTPRHFKCCNTSTQGCTTGPHLYKQVQHAPKYKDLALSPTASSQTPKRKALVLDCEMALNIHRQQEVILLCAVDYFTGEVLINNLIQPTLPIHDWRTEINGITAADMQKAASRRTALSSWKQARAQLWQLIDRDTILVGHALQNDLDVLRMVHTRVVDSAILARNAVGMYSLQWGLQGLCRELLKLEIRENEGGVHDGLEDVMATREVVLWCVGREGEFGAWAKERREEEVRKETARKVAREKKLKAKAKAKAVLGLREQSDYEDDYSDDEVLYWEDIAVDCGWPHPDTGYYPWSD